MSDPEWASWPDEKLLEARFCDLGVTIEGTDLEARIARIDAELDSRSLKFRPHYWLADEWFTPDDVPGIAIPFYLAHPRLAKLELAQMLEVEGGDEESCLQILRHEVGHAIDNAYRLRRRPTRRRLFGAPATPYPEYYLPNLTVRASFNISIAGTPEPPGRRFRRNVRRVARSPVDVVHALRRLARAAKARYMDRLMRELTRRKPIVKSKRTVDPVSKLKRTLGEHYRKKREHYRLDRPDFYESDLRNLFSDSPEFAKNQTAAKFLSKRRKEVRSTVASFTESYQYTIDQILEQIIERCRELNLRLSDTGGVDEGRFHGVPDRADDELPAQRAASGCTMTTSRLRVLAL